MLNKTNSFKIRHKLVALVFIALFLGSPIAQTSPATDPPEKPLKPEEHNSKIETQLELISSIARNRGHQKATSKARSMGISLSERGSVKAVIEKKQGTLILPSELREFGARVLGQTPRLIEVLVPLKSIEPLVESVEEIDYIRSPHRFSSFNVEYGSYFSDGVNLTGGGLFHGRNLLGQGVKIGVIDIGFASYYFAREGGEFPEGSVKEKKDYTGEGFTGGSAHGTAVAELVHDMSPLSELYLMRVNSEVDLQEAVQDAISRDIDIIVHSVGWVNTNFGDGTGVIADIVKEAIDNGMLWVNAAGNSAKKHWEGPASDQDNDRWVEFKNGKEYIEVKVNFSSSIQLFLTWNDWPKSDKDFDLFLYDGDGNLLDSSQNYQTGNENPSESLSHSASPKNRYYLKVSAPEEAVSSNLEIFSFNHELEPFKEEGSVMAPGNVGEVMTVGAINENSWKRGELEYFSSQGPTSDGRIKPDLVGPDGVTTFIYGNFLGTSAAAPHAAGAAALLLSREPDFGPEQLKDALKENTKDLGPDGPDNLFGWGKMDLIYKNPSATRTIQTENDDKIKPGDKVTINVQASMPVTLQGGLELTENVPEPLKIVKVNHPNSGKASGQQVLARWPIVKPGEEKLLSYQVLVPENAPPGEYEFSGLINGQSIEGSSTANILKLTDESTSRNSELNLERTDAFLDQFGHRIHFSASGKNISQIRVKVYSTSGQEVFDSEWVEGVEYQWNLHDDEGNTVPNGIYLYYVLVKGQSGDIERSELDKILALR